MTSTTPKSQITAFLGQVPPFDRLSVGALDKLASKCELLRYRTGQPILERGQMTDKVFVIYEGQVRELAGPPNDKAQTSLRLAGSGEIFGWVSQIRGIACEAIYSSTESICIVLPAEDFLTSVKKQADFGQAFRERVSHLEIFELLSQELDRRANATASRKELTHKLWHQAVAVNLPNKQVNLANLDPGKVWFVSRGTIGEYNTGSVIAIDSSKPQKLKSQGDVRLIGLPYAQITKVLEPTDSAPSDSAPEETAPKTPEIPYAPLPDPEAQFDPLAPVPKYPFIRGKGEIDIPLACFMMLAKHLNIKVKKDSLRRVLKDQLSTSGRLNLQSCGYVGAAMGLNPQLIAIPAELLPRLKAPAIIRWENGFALLYEISPKRLIMAIPTEKEVIVKKPEEFIREWETENGQGQVLLLPQSTEDEGEKFGFGWFWPELMKHKGILFQVFLASFFVQLFGLANPLITQVIIDKVLVQRSIDTLHVLGVFMVAVAAFEAMLTGLRTYLFVDTTNRVDLSLSSQVIDHLLRLPLNYFDKRRVGELAGRIGELERIRQFMTGTALTVVLDAIFSVIYIGVLLSYSIIMTLVALATIPLFTLLIVFVSPIIRRLLRKRAERYADAQSYLVEVLNGMQTVKAQTIELTSRWSWYERYARYVSAGFKTVITSTAASSFSGFLNKLSGLLLLWVGAYRVLNGDMTLGQLIAFRIIASNVTGSLLRFVQVWQSFQETAMSVERLRDIMDADTEADENNRNNIPMPEIKGAVRFEDVSFRFGSSGPLQLVNINLEFEPGQFVGIVGQSGSGKSTLMKLVQRLYDPMSGVISVDTYDISKVELYSLRRQIGVVLQDTLLFNGSVQENISLTNPDATTEEITEAAKIAVAHDFVMGLSNGYNTVVGEKGSSLSGGQRQRIAIARTILQNPHLLILDEATSALDYRSERDVSQNIQQHFKGRTVFFITHRLQTVQQADVILMMDKGYVVEKGTHDELMTLKGSYYSLYQQQEAQM